MTDMIPLDHQNGLSLTPSLYGKMSTSILNVM